MGVSPKKKIFTFNAELLMQRSLEVALDANWIYSAPSIPPLIKG